jgi:hypothetical protein
MRRRSSETFRLAAILFVIAGFIAGCILGWPKEPIKADPPCVPPPREFTAPAAPWGSP